MNRHPFPGAERPMPLIDAIGRRWWAFPLALLISLFRSPNPRDLTGLTVWTQEQQP